MNGKRLTMTRIVVAMRQWFSALRRARLAIDRDEFAMECSGVAMNENKPEMKHKRARRGSGAVFLKCDHQYFGGAEWNSGVDAYLPNRMWTQLEPPVNHPGMTILESGINLLTKKRELWMSLL